MRTALRAALALLAVLVLWPVPAGADGCYIPEKAVRKLPEIPGQRAVVSFKDGRETLIVESRLEGQGRRFGGALDGRIAAATSCLGSQSPVVATDAGAYNGGSGERPKGDLRGAAA